MHLTKIKLAGFKSFVDPTVVLLPSNLVAIVGPNGCGKSNIIDAVCWVMGESSAKYLRGESLTDVIFNGSTARKPVGLASIELVFDNGDGTIGGEYASYAEISIRRQITRDSESSYFLNGTRCRRRDIIDIFLGTGLGPRGYSIIGQNMIQRVVEAKPDEMRIYLEEAAGISKYKERRKETENRIQHTKDNLARLNDIRTELEKQLATLKRQANAAEKFKVLKMEERQLRAQWLAIQWRHYDSRMVGETLQIQQQSTGLEARQAEMSDLNLQLDYKRESQRIAQDQLQEVQRHYYAVGNEVTRLEQEIQHHQTRAEERQKDFAETEKNWLEINTQIEESESESADLTKEIEECTPKAFEAIQIASDAEDMLASAEESMHQWQAEWDEFNQKASKQTQIAEVEQTRIQHLEQKITTLTEQQQKRAYEKSQFNFSKLENEITTFTNDSVRSEEKVTQRKTELASVIKNINDLQALERDLNNQLDDVRSKSQVVQGKYASLETLQQTALGQRDSTMIAWLKNHKLDKNPRLAQHVEVEKGWESAVEKVLGAYLQAICMEQLSDATPLAQTLETGSLYVIAKNQSKTLSQNKKSSLLSKVKSSFPLDSMLAQVYTAENQNEALEMLHSLESHESVITKDAIWMGSSWMAVSRNDRHDAGVFQREQELKSLQKNIHDLDILEKTLNQNLLETRDKIKQLESERESIQKLTNEAYAETAAMSMQLKIHQSRLDEFRKREAQLIKEQNECQQALQNAEDALSNSRALWKDAMAILEKESTERTRLTEQRDSLRDELQRTRTNAKQAKDSAHQFEIRLQTMKSQLASLENLQARLQTQADLLNERKATLHDELHSESQLERLKNELENTLKGRIILQGELTSAKQACEIINQEIHELEQKRQDLEREISRFRDMLEALRVEWQGAKVKADTLIEQISETGFNIEDILQEIPDTATPNEWLSRLEQVTQRISRLGAINLVAIEEYTACSERKEYLDKQNEDLQQGLTTLETAISKMDKETRLRFKQTFDKVNTRFQELFPLVFGGGQAYLELTGENLLDTGITVMACPPGKRNSTIHLLSGGEKAMTAIALVFSIFYLNPAPFCLLDEVDAPLDDANIGRFCNLVKAMSDKTQFIFISHNKLAIEMAETLIGVTMNEPGVSRLVTVDVKQAINLAGA